MKTITYNKLVRDKIPEIIKNTGKECGIEILSDEKYLRMLDAKLDEELDEYHKEQNLEELADLLEVVYATAIARGYSVAELEDCRMKKKMERGGFEQKILLKEVGECVYPQKYLDELQEEINDIKAKITSGEQPVFHSVDALLDSLEAE